MKINAETVALWAFLLLFYGLLFLLCAQHAYVSGWLWVTQPGDLVGSIFAGFFGCVCVTIFVASLFAE